MDARSWKWTDAHFCSLPSQTNIYGCSKIIGSGMTKKLLVASLVGKFYTIEYQRIFDKLTPSTKEVQFTYIPGKVLNQDTTYYIALIIVPDKVLFFNQKSTDIFLFL